MPKAKKIAKKEKKPVAKASKKTTSSTKVTKSKVEKAQINTTKKPAIKRNRKLIKTLLIITLVGAVAVGLIALKDHFIVATVNGKPITRWELTKELEKQAGQQILESMVVENIINQESSKLNIAVTQEDIDGEIDKIREQVSSQGTSLEDALAQRSMTLQDLQKQIKTQKKLEKLLQDRIEVTEEEVTTYYDENKDTLYKDLDEATAKEQIKEEIKAQKMQYEASAYIEELKSKANIKHYLFKVPSTSSQ
jgi:foldase protein PrsA